MNSPQQQMCDCPFCPLVRLNVQACDVFVKIVKTKNGGRYEAAIPTTVCEGRADEEKEIIRDCFVHLAVWSNDEMRKKRTNALHGEKNDCVLNVEKHGRSTVRICFHAKQQEVIEDPE